MLAALLLTAGAAVASDVWIADPEFDFGFVIPNSTLAYHSWIHNDSPDTLHLADIKTGCGCLAASSRRATLFPGDSIPFDLHWQTRGLEGPVSRVAYVYVDELADPLRVSVSGRPRLAGDSVSGVVSTTVAIRFEPGRATERSMRLVNLTAEELPVRLVMAPNSSVKPVFPQSLPAKGEGLMKVTLAGELSPEPFEDSFTLEFQSQAGYIYRLSIPVLNGDFSYRPVFSKTSL